MTNSRTAFAAAIAALTGLAAAPGLAADGQVLSDPAAAVTADPEIAAMVPEALAGGTINMAVYGNTPFTMTDADLMLYGAVVDLGAALAAKMGLTPAFEDVASVASSKVAVESGRFEIGMGPFLDSPDAEEDFLLVRWIAVTPGYVFRAGEDYAEPLDFCGKTIAIVSGSVPVERNMEAMATVCTEAGMEAQEVAGYSDQNASVVAVLSGRADGAMLSSASALYMQNTQPDKIGAFSADSDIFNVGLYSGFGVAKTNSELAEAAQAAMQALADDGTYEAIFAEYGLEDLLVDNFAINPITSASN